MNLGAASVDLVGLLSPVTQTHSGPCDSSGNVCSRSPAGRRLVNGVVPVGSSSSALEVLNMQGHDDTQCQPEKPSGESEVGVKKKSSPCGKAQKLSLKSDNWPL